MHAVAQGAVEIDDGPRLLCSVAVGAIPRLSFLWCVAELSSPALGHRDLPSSVGQGHAGAKPNCRRITSRASGRERAAPARPPGVITLSAGAVHRREHAPQEHAAPQETPHNFVVPFGSPPGERHSAKLRAVGGFKDGEQQWIDRLEYLRNVIRQAVIARQLGGRVAAGSTVLDASMSTRTGQSGSSATCTTTMTSRSDGGMTIMVPHARGRMTADTLVVGSHRRDARFKIHEGRLERTRVLAGLFLDDLECRAAALTVGANQGWRERSGAAFGVPMPAPRKGLDAKDLRPSGSDRDAGGRAAVRRLRAASTDDLQLARRHHSGAAQDVTHRREVV